MGEAKYKVCTIFDSLKCDFFGGNSDIPFCIWYKQFDIQP